MEFLFLILKILRIFFILFCVFFLVINFLMNIEVCRFLYEVNKIFWFFDNY